MPEAPPPARALCVSLGALEWRADESLASASPKLRAVAPAGGQRRAELAFTLLGDVEDPAPLASGEMRRQIGLKLRAADACNLVYVMWRVARAGPLVVAIKQNPGLHASRECGARGYARIEPRSARTLAVPRVGEPHALVAELAGASLRVSVDGALAWEGELPPAANALSGPAGLRSDNVRWSGRLALDPPPAAARCPDDVVTTGAAAFRSRGRPRAPRSRRRRRVQREPAAMAAIAPPNQYVTRPPAWYGSCAGRARRSIRARPGS